MIKSFKGFLNESSLQLTPQQIEWCNKHIEGEWKINEKGEVYTPSGNVEFKEKSFTRFEVQFADTQGDFYCDYCPQLESLEGAPSSVGGSFLCHYTQLKTLEGAPSSVGGNFRCHYTQLKTLEGAPTSVGGNFYCHICPQLKSLQGAPTSVGGDFNCHECPQLDPREVDLVENHPELFRVWLKLGTPPIEEFLDPQSKYRGAVKGKKFGI